MSVKAASISLLLLIHSDDMLTCVSVGAREEYFYFFIRIKMRSCNHFNCKKGNPLVFSSKKELGRFV